MKLKRNRLIACLVAAVMLIGILPLSLFAAGETGITAVALTYDGTIEPCAGASTYMDVNKFSADVTATRDGAPFAAELGDWVTFYDWGCCWSRYNAGTGVWWGAGNIGSDTELPDAPKYKLELTLQSKSSLSVPFDISTPSNFTLNGMAATDITIYDGRMTLSFEFAGALPKASTPSAYFTATGSDTGKLTNVYEGMTYQIGDGEPVAITSSTVNLTGLAPCEIKIVRKGVDGVSKDSDPQVLTVTRAAVPTGVTMVPCSSAANNDGVLNGVNGGMDFKIGEGEWTKGSFWGDYPPFEAGTVIKVRTRALYDALASEELTFTIAPYGTKTGEVSVSLGESFKMNFYVKNLTGDDVAKAKVVYTFLGNEYEGKANVSGFSFDGIAPQYIGETLNAKLYIGDFLAYEAECSIKSYLEAVTAEYPTDEALQTLANDILVYGGAAQTYTSYKTGELVSEGVTGTTFVPLDDSYGSYALENNEEFVKFTSATLHFDDVVSLKVKFKKTSDEPFEMVYGGDTVDYVKNGDDYIITVPVMAKFITGSAATFAVDEAGGAELTYGVGNYIYAMQGRDDAMGKLAKALWNYGLAAAAYTS